LQKNNWDINNSILEIRTNKKLKEYLTGCITSIEKVNDNQIIQGLGELLNAEKDKVWVKQELRKETIFLLRNYQSIL